MSATTVHAAPFRLPTEESMPARQLPARNDVLSRSISREHLCGGNECARRKLTPTPDGSCQMDVTAQPLTVNEADGVNGVRVQRTYFSRGLSAQRTRELLDDGDDDIVLNIHVSGRCIVSQLGRQATVEAGGGLLTSNADASTIIFPQAARFASIGVPRRPMMVLVPGLEDAFVRPVAQDTGILRLLLKYLGVLEDEDALRTPALRRAIVTHIHDLCALAIGAGHNTAEIAGRRGLRAARLRALKADIAHNLRNGDVSAGALGLRHGVSPRYVRKLFEGEGTSLSHFVLNQRLVWVHRMLTNPGRADLAISSVAYSVGFNDISTFNREFRRHFGATPSEVRAAKRLVAEE